MTDIVQVQNRGEQLPHRIQLGYLPQHNGLVVGSGWPGLAELDVRQCAQRGSHPAASDDSYADYERDSNLQRAIRKLEQLNGWDAGRLFPRAFFGARSDILYIRASQFVTDGTIPVKEAQQLIDGAVEMVTAAAELPAGLAGTSLVALRRAIRGGGGFCRLLGSVAYC